MSEGRVRSDEAPDHHQLAVGEVDQLASASQAHNPDKLLGSIRRRVDDHVDTETVGSLTDVRVLDPSDSRLGALFLGREAGQDVGTIGVGHRDEQVGLVGSGLLEHVRASTVSMEHQGVDRLLELGGAFLVVLDDDDILAFGGETLGEVGPDRPRTHDDYSLAYRIPFSTESKG